MSAVYIRLAGPLQSWAGPKLTGNISYTNEHPGHRALSGLVAAALGAHRGDWPAWFNSMTFDVRIDAAGDTIDEFHTINPTPEDGSYRRRVLTLLTARIASEGRATFTPDGQDKTAVIRRTYLSDAEFIVRIAADGHAEEIDAALANPKFLPYLGKKAFSPGFPFYLGCGNGDVFAQIPTFAPLYRDHGKRISARAKNHSYLGSEAEVDSTKVLKVVHSASGGISTESRVSVPAVSTRSEWLDAVATIPGLHRRATISS